MILQYVRTVLARIAVLARIPIWEMGVAIVAGAMTMTNVKKESITVMPTEAPASTPLAHSAVDVKEVLLETVPIARISTNVPQESTTVGAGLVSIVQVHTTVSRRQNVLLIKKDLDTINTMVAKEVITAPTVPKKVITGGGAINSNI